MAEEKAEMVGGTVCPTCGLRQGHIHLGWPMPPEMGEEIGAQFTYLDCDSQGCDCRALIVRFQSDVPHNVVSKIEKAIWEAFGHEPPSGGGCKSHVM